MAVRLNNSEIFHKEIKEVEELKQVKSINFYFYLCLTIYRLDLLVQIPRMQSKSLEFVRHKKTGDTHANFDC
jgi:hypothetical protein